MASGFSRSGGNPVQNAFGSEAEMNAKPPVLILLRSPETIRKQYYAGITQAFPDLKVTLVDNAAKAELSHLADAEIIITHGPHLEERAGFVFTSAPRLRWVRGI